MSELEAAIEAGDVERTIAVLEPMREDERRNAAPAVVALHAAAHREEPFATRHTAATLALFGTGTMAQAAKCGYDGHPGLERVLRARRPAWLQEWCDAVADRRWALVRRLARAGAIERRRTERYTIGLIAQSTTVHPLEVFAEQPELLEAEVWDLFVYEGNGENSLSSADKYAKDDRGWAGALATLESRGTLSRARLLDASLDALERDFPQFRAGWFSRFHETLAPTLNERAARAERYVRLLQSRVPPTVAFALDALASLEKAGRPLPSATLAALPGVSTAKAKGTALEALRLGALLLERLPEAERRGRAATFAVAFEHPAREVQSAALDLLERHARRDDPALRERLANAAAGIVPSLRERFAKLYAPEAPESPSVVAASAVSRPATSPPAFARAALEPLADVDALVEAFAAVLEGEVAPEELERVLDGVSRLCAERPPDFERVTGPLRKRADRILDPKNDGKFAPVRRVFARLARVWLSGDAVPAGATDLALPEFLRARVEAIVARAMQRRPRVLLAAPTHAGCVIEPLRLVARFADANGAVDRLDTIAALLRLSASGREEALRAATGLGGESGAALRYALGADDVRVGPDAALWIAASRARYPFDDDPVVEAMHPGFGPDATRRARPALEWNVREWSVPHRPGSPAKTYRHCTTLIRLVPELPAPLAADTPSVRRWDAEREPRFLPTPELLRWAGSIWPLQREGWFAEGCVRIGSNLDWWSAQWANRTYFEPLLESDVRVGIAGGLLLALGLLAKDATEGVLATDALALALADGRLDAAGLATIFGHVVAWNPYTLPRRAAPRIAQVARTSPQHARLACEALGGALHGADASGAAALRPLRDLLRELTIETAAEAVAEPQRALR
jgi:hypothetical protein